MKRILLALAAGLSALGLIAPGVASAQIVELGQTSSSPVTPPACPTGVSLSNCVIVLTRTTALQTETNGLLNPTKVTKDGWIVAFTVGLSKLTSDAKTELSLLKNLDGQWGGPPQLVLSVLKPGPKNKYTVAAQSATFHVLPFLGSVLQEPLSLPPTFTTMTALPVKKGEVIGLTVLTWAPVLTYNLTANKYSYRQSRQANCTHAAGGQTAQTTVGASQQYLCNYTGTRVQYSATEVVNQPYPKTYVGGPTSTK
ncbi:MAG: hypothetical protein WAU75_00805 [Solirubrobacteraceae bacterium]